MEQAIKNLLKGYKKEMNAELDAILSYWSKNTFDTINGGFAGRIDENNIVDNNAPKGSVLNSRILWTFSAAYTITKNKQHLHLARIAYNYISNNFVDKEYGGVYWSLNANGKPLDTKKQIYALAFAIYGCSAYYTASNNEAAKDTAIQLYNTIEQYSFDKEHKGYLDAFARDWEPMDDIRLSAKDANEMKTMNTHLHVLEAYTTLYKIWPDAVLKEKIKLLMQNFTQHIINTQNHHLVLFFDEQWNVKSDTISYGHDIEAAWLFLEAAEVIHDHELIETIKTTAVKIADAASEGLDKDGGLWYEYEPSSNHFIKEKHWWVQAETIVGFFTAWQLTGDDAYLQKSVNAWNYVQQFIKDKNYGEWYWGLNENGAIIMGQDKVGIWKCPYHNTRACIEIINRINSINQ